MAPTQKFKSIRLAGTEDGLQIAMEIVAADDSTLAVLMSTQSAANVALQIEATVAKAVELQEQRFGAAREHLPIKPRAVSGLRGGRISDGRALVILQLSDGMELELAFPPEQVKELHEWFGTLAETLRETQKRTTN